MEIRFELSDADRSIVWAGGVQRERREIIPGSRLGDLASPGQPFASPEAEPGGWDKIFEPVIVAGIVTFSGSSTTSMSCMNSGQELAGLITTRLVE